MSFSCHCDPERSEGEAIQLFPDALDCFVCLRLPRMTRQYNRALRRNARMPKLNAAAMLLGLAFIGAAPKLAVSYSATADFAPAFIAKEEGIFSKHGLDVTLSNLATTALGPPALQSGSLQIASISPPLLLLANDGGMDLVAVAGVAALDAKEPNSALVTRPGFIATKAEDF